MQPLTTMPAGTLILMGSWNTHLVGEACILQGAHPPEDNSILGAYPPHTDLPSLC